MVISLAGDFPYRPFMVAHLWGKVWGRPVPWNFTGQAGRSPGHSSFAVLHHWELWMLRPTPEGEEPTEGDELRNSERSEIRVKLFGVVSSFQGTPQPISIAGINPAFNQWKCPCEVLRPWTSPLLPRPHPGPVIESIVESCQSCQAKWCHNEDLQTISGGKNAEPTTGHCHGQAVTPVTPVTPSVVLVRMPLQGQLPIGLFDGINLCIAAET